MAEGGVQEGRNNFNRHMCPDYARSQAENIDVVVLDHLMGGVGLVSDRGTNAAELVRGHARPSP